MRDVNTAAEIQRDRAKGLTVFEQKLEERLNERADEFLMVPENLTDVWDCLGFNNVASAFIGTRGDLAKQRQMWAAWHEKAKDLLREDVEREVAEDEFFGE